MPKLEVDPVMTIFMFNIQEQDGYYGAFTRDQADGALPSGTRIRKTFSEPDDMTPTGTLGTVLGSVMLQGHLVYFIEWDNAPKRAVATLHLKVEALKDSDDGPAASLD